MTQSGEKSSTVYRARAARARRIAEMLVGIDANTVLTYAKECDATADTLALIESVTAQPAKVIVRKTIRPIVEAA